MLEGLFLSVAGSVVSYVIEKLEPAEQIKKWLRREPSTLAFQKALSRAYTAFARQYPEYTASLFDQSFLVGAGAPELAKLLTRHLKPDPALFAIAWANSIGLDEISTFRAEATKPAAEFLKWLEAELKSEAAFQPFFDSRALESLPKLERQIEKLTTELKHDLEDTLKVANDYKTAIEVGGDVGGSIVVGDNNRVSVKNVYNNYYSGAFATLNDYYIAPDAVFERVRIDEFVGREWLTAKVDEFLNDPRNKSGIFLLVGEAGVGKTSFMAHLVEERRYLHLFAEQVPGDANLQRALQSLGSQLVTRYQIDPYKDRDTLTQLAAFPDFLDKLLRLAANTLAKGEKIVIVCDALDEAGTASDGNVFGLPNVLPDNIYFVLSQRPVSTKLPNVNTQWITLEAQGEKNLQDMQDYLKAVTKRPEIAGQLRSKNYSDEFFVRTLKEKSLGVWMYLHYIIEEVGKGSRAPLELENLPTGLVGYYADYWSDWREGKNGRGEGLKQWDELYAPLVTTLAVAQQPIKIEQLMTWAGINAHKWEVARLLQEKWSSFLAIREDDNVKTYGPYHASFKDFLIGNVDIAPLRPSESYLVQELVERSKEAHKRIVSVFHTDCRGDWPVLADQSYPRLHLTTHLAGTRDFNTLIDLLTEGDAHIAWAEARYQKEETYAGFLSDLEHMWRYVERKNELVLCVRSMLIENSIHSLATNIPPDLLTELAKSGMWSYPRCLTTISHMSKYGQQAEAFDKIAKFIPADLHYEAISIIENIKDHQSRAASFISLIPYLSEDIKLQSLGKTISSINKIPSLNIRFHEFIKLIPHVSEDLKQEALQSVVNALPKIDPETRVSVIVDLTAYLSEDVKSQILQKSRGSVEEIIDSNTDIFIRLISYLSVDFQPQLLSAIKRLKTDREQSEALLALIPQLNDDNLISILDVAQEIRDSEYRARILTKLIPYLKNDLKSTILQQAIAASQEIEWEYDRAIALTLLIPHLNDNLKSEILRDILTITQSMADKQDYFVEDYLENILSKLIPHLNEDLQLKAVDIVQKISGEYRRAGLLIDFVPYLGNDLKAWVLASVEEIKDEERKVRSLIDLMPHLSQDLEPQILGNILSIIRASDNHYLHTSTIINVLPHLNENLREEILREAFVAAQEIRSEDIRERALTDLVPHVSGVLKTLVLQEILVIKHKISDEEYRVSALSSLIGDLKEDAKLEVKQDVLAIIQNMKDGHVRARALINFVPYLNHRFEAQGLTIARGFKLDEERAETLISLIPYLSNDLKSQAQHEALIAVQNVRPESIQIRILADLVPLLDNDLRSKALLHGLDTIESFEDDLRRGLDYREGMLASLLPFLNDELLYRALLIVQNTKNERERAQTLSALIPYLIDNLKPQALAIAKEINNPYHLSGTLLTLLPYLSNDLQSLTLQEALHAARNIEHKISRCRTLIDLIPHLSDDLKPQIVHETLSALGLIEESEDATANTLMSLMPYLHIIHIPQVLDIANRIKHQSSRAEILIALIPISNDVIPKALATVQEIRNDNARTQALASLMPYLSDDLKQDVLTMVLEIDHVYYRATALIALLSHVSNDLKQLALNKALEYAQIIPWGEHRADVLSNLLPHVNDDQKTLVRKGILDAIETIEDEESKATKLVNHASLFEDPIKIDMLGGALLIANFELIETIINEWKKIDFIGIDKFIYNFLRKTAQSERSIGLSIQSKLLPALVHFGQPRICNEILRSIRDTARWWR